MRMGYDNSWSELGQCRELSSHLPNECLKEALPWPVWLHWVDTTLCMERQPVPSTIMAHAQLVGSFPGREHARGSWWIFCSHICIFLSSPFLSFYKSIKNENSLNDKGFVQLQYDIHIAFRIWWCFSPELMLVVNVQFCGIKHCFIRIGSLCRS